ncbi:MULTISPECIES: YbjN domain-containing protein [Lichenihabitans]|uniref:YbjN domain-containing protein n=1 Tax=Lichenihabitans TaxID=2723776 RepID=UPI001035C8E5|nr:MULTISPECIES: YbjN domain-containing protein [Lichenihabitans]UDL93888.1 YbjN domain-containing protein [Lichenihabitans sp. PAMC28606]
MSLLPIEVNRAEHPVDVVERIASFHDWAFDRDDEDEISISVQGGFSDYHVAFTWLSDLEALHVGCAFDIKVPDRRRTAILGLIALINEHLWIGHFDLWNNENVVMFRHSILMSGGADPDGRQCEAILKMAVETCDRYYQAFQFVIWAGKTAREALDSAMFETQGEA